MCEVGCVQSLAAGDCLTALSSDNREEKKAGGSSYA